MNDQTRRKKVLALTDFSLTKSGFGRFLKALLEYLYGTGKYDLVNLAMGSADVQNDFDRTPWKSIPAVNVNQLDQIKRQNDPRVWENIERMAGYGAYTLDQVVKDEKPDVFFGIQDIWGVDFAVDKPWFNKIPSVIWTTLDSLPILPKAVEIAPKVKHYWCWADFATKALHKLGQTHVKTVRGALDTKPFYRLSDKQRLELRQQFGISENTFVIGFVFRNQLRKSVHNLLQGFKQFKTQNPKVVTKLLLHTCWVEGWDIPKLMAELDIKPEEVLTTYVCKNCRSYQVKPFITNEQDCPHCRTQKSQCTTHPSIGVSESQLNEVYNLMDVYCHPFTSGGQEIPIQEAKLTELITLVTNYSCGEDMCVPEAASLPLDWAEYREPGTQFIKATTYPSDICKQLSKVLNMKENTRREMGKQARQWVIDNFSIEIIGKIVEEFIDAAPFASSEAFKDGNEIKDPYYNVPEIADNTEWLLDLYRNILKMGDITPNDQGLKYWKSRLEQGVNRKDIEDYFRKVALSENQKIQTTSSFEDLLDKNDKGRVIIVQPESAGDIFMLTALFPSIKKRYPDKALYIATKPEYRSILDGNPYVDHWLEYHPLMDNIIWLEGNAQHKGYFDIAYLPFISTQRTLNYLHNGQDTLDFIIN